MTFRKPFKHQEEARDFLLMNKKAILSDEQGGGKTMSAILAADQVFGKKLIVCPASLKYNWKKEIGMVTGGTCHIISKHWIDSYINEWTIINYDLLTKYHKDIVYECFDVVIFDEAHMCRAIDFNGNPRTHRAKMLLSLSQEIEYSFLLTGTPVVNTNVDLFNLLKAVNHPVSRDFTAFIDEFCGASLTSYGRNIKNNTNSTSLFRRIHYKLLRRLKSDFADLPVKQRRFIPLEVDFESYNRRVAHYLKQRDLTEEGAHLVKLNAMRKALAEEKVDNTIDLIQNLLCQDKPVVVFTNFTSVVDRLLERFPEAVSVTGSDSAKQRQQAVDDFQNGKSNVIVCNMISGSTGITLIRAADLIFNDMDYVPANHLQAEDRIHRIGQDQSCTLYYMFALNTVDEKISNLLQVKMKNMGKTIDGKSDESFEAELLKVI